MLIYIIVKILKAKDKNIIIILQGTKENWHVKVLHSFKLLWISHTTTETRRQWNATFKVLKGLLV